MDNDSKRRVRDWASFRLLISIVVLAGLLLSACDELGLSQSGSEPTPDIEATVVAAVQAALTAQTHTSQGSPDLEATVTVRVAAALAAQSAATDQYPATSQVLPFRIVEGATAGPEGSPSSDGNSSFGSTVTPTPTWTPTSVPTSTPIPTQTPTSVPTSTPTPTRVPTLTATPAATRTPEAQFSEIEVSYRLQLYFAEQYELTESAYYEFLFQLANSPGDLFAARALGWDSEAAQREIWLWAGRSNGKMQPKYEGKGAWLITVSDIVVGDRNYAPAEQWWFFESGDTPPLMR